MEYNITEVLPLYNEMCSAFLHTQLLYLTRALVASETIDRALMPAAISRNVDEVLFGGVLFDIEPGAVCRIDTAFGLCFAAMALQDKQGFLLIGPYFPEENMDFNPEDILAAKGVPLESTDSYLHYYESVTSLTKDNINLIFKAFDQGLHGKITIKTFTSHLAVTPESPSPCPVLDEDSIQMQADIIAKRYASEEDILHKISVGDFEAIKSIGATTLNLNRFANKLRNEKNQAIILNTLARKSIQSAHIHPYHIDIISGKWAIRIEQATNIDALHALMHELLYDYCRIVHTHSLKNYSSNVRAMLNYVQFNLSEKISLEDIAKRLKTNATYLSQQFNKEVGKSLPEYISEKRINDAKRMLCSQQALSIGQVASNVGFADVNYFAKVFKKQTGQTPSEYREKSQGTTMF